MSRTCCFCELPISGSSQAHSFCMRSNNPMSKRVSESENKVEKKQKTTPPQTPILLVPIAIPSDAEFEKDPWDSTQFKAVDFDSDSAQKASDDSDSDSGINIGSQDDTDFLDAVQQLEDRRAVEIEAELHRHSEVLKMIQAKHYDQLEKLFIQKY